MRIPRSTIAMAVLTCIPFGFAIRDYLNGKDKVGYEDFEDDDEIDADEAYAKYREQAAVETAREEVRRAERKEQLVAAFETMFEDAPASLGPAFGPIKPGITDMQLGKADETTTALRKLGRAHDFLISYNDSDGILHDLTITPTDTSDDGELVCDTLREQLEEKWSSGGADRVGATTVWTDVATGIRAELLHEYGCSLTFRQFVQPETWVAKKSGVVPVDAIGQPISKLVKSLEPQRLDLSEAEYELTWSAPGLGIGAGDTQLKAYISRGKVVALTARTNIATRMRAPVVAHLEEVFGPSAEDEDGDLVWKKQPRMTLVTGYDEASIALTVGAIPEE